MSSKKMFDPFAIFDDYLFNPSFGLMTSWIAYGVVVITLNRLQAPIIFGSHIFDYSFMFVSSLMAWQFYSGLDKVIRKKIIYWIVYKSIEFLFLFANTIVTFELLPHVDLIVLEIIILILNLLQIIYVVMLKMPVTEPANIKNPTRVSVENLDAYNRTRYFNVA